MKNKHYRHFLHASQQLANIESIDYYLANQLVYAYNQADNKLLYHVFMALSESLRQGHTCLPLHVIAGQCWASADEKTNVDAKKGFQFPSIERLTALFSSVDFDEHANMPVIYWHDCLYLRRYFNFEKELAQAIKGKLTGTRQQTDLALLTQCLHCVFPDTKSLNVKENKEPDWQMISVANALNKDFTIIAGGPGTGKTYTVTKLLAAIILKAKLQQKALPTIAMVAPTGKAAQRLSESIGKTVSQFRRQLNTLSDDILAAIPEQAQTIHRLLGVIPNQLQFKHHQDNLLAIEVLLVDEASMVDLALMTRLFRALPEHCQVILLGDADQLPSVQSGSVLNELAPKPHLGYSKTNMTYLQQLTGQNISSFLAKESYASDHLTLLTQSRRFDGEGGIGLLAKAVIEGESHSSWQLLQQQNSQLTHVSSKTLTADNDYLMPLVKQYFLPLLDCNTIDEAFECFKQFRVLVATRQGKSGVEFFNEEIKNRLQRLWQQKSGQVLAINSLYHGQPIMISENNYQTGLFNGDIGFIWQDQAGHLMAVFETNTDQPAFEENSTNEPTNYRYFLISQLPQYETVYAMTIHKTQGSEFEHVLMVLPEQSDHQLLSRELLYTGITRAKKHLSVVAKSTVWQQAVQQKVKRYANLAKRLTACPLN